MTDPRYEQAKILRSQGRSQDAAQLLAELVADDPADVAAQYALGIALVESGRPDAAVAPFREVVDRRPGHFQAAYRLGCILQDAGEHALAADAFRKVLAVSNHGDTAARLAACLSAAAVPARRDPMPTPGTSPAPAPTPVRDLSGRPPSVPPVRRSVESTNSAHPGALRYAHSLKPRFQAPWLIGALALGVLLSLLPDWIVAAARRYGDAEVVYEVATFFASPGVDSVIDLVVLLAWIVGVPVAILSMVLQPRFNRVQFHDHGMRLSMGLIRHTQQIIWYYQIAQPPSVDQGLREYATHTATLDISYNTTPQQTERISLTGLGSPAEMKKLCEFLEIRILVERAAYRGPWL